ncbi:MAG TPA: GTP cyclohydrolase I FolE [Longimicrobiaceae bacterium]
MSPAAQLERERRRAAAPQTGGRPAIDDGDVELQGLVRRMLELLGEEPDRPGLVDTPKRVAKAMRWLTRGYGTDAEGAIAKGIFEERHDSMVLVKGIEMYSMCEHHMLPFYGQVHVAYIPDGRIVGLSKLARVVDVFARRLQVQERLTDQIADALTRVLRPKGVGVVVEARHLCMMMRGVEKQNSQTVTSAMRGTFVDCPMTREEFLRLALREG